MFPGAGNTLSGSSGHGGGGGASVFSPFYASAPGTCIALQYPSPSRPPSLVGEGFRSAAAVVGVAAGLGSVVGGF